MVAYVHIQYSTFQCFYTWNWKRKNILAKAAAGFCWDKTRKYDNTLSFKFDQLNLMWFIQGDKLDDSQLNAIRTRILKLLRYRSLSCPIFSIIKLTVESSWPGHTGFLDYWNEGGGAWAEHVSYIWNVHLSSLVFTPLNTEQLFVQNSRGICYILCILTYPYFIPRSYLKLSREDPDEIETFTDIAETISSALLQTIAR